MAGTYTETSVCEPSVGVSIEGSGADNTIVQVTLGQERMGLLQLWSNQGVNGNQTISDIQFDGRNLTTPLSAISIQGRGNVEIRDCIFKDFDSYAALISAKDVDTVSAPATYSKNNSFHDNVVTNCAVREQSGGFTGSVSIGGQHGMLIYNNTITENQKPVGENGIPIKFYSGGYNRGLKIYNNTLTAKPVGSSDNSNGYDFAIELWYTESGSEIYDNTIINGCIDIDHTINSLDLDYALSIHDNIIYNAVANTYIERGVLLEGEIKDVIVENNIIYNKSHAIHILTKTNNVTENIIIRKNLMYNIGIADRTGESIRVSKLGGSSGASITYLYILNNTIISVPDQNYYGISIGGDAAASMDYVYIQNNIVENVSLWAVVIPGPIMNRVWYQNNNLYNNANSNDPLYNGGNPTNLTSSGNLKNNPLYVGGGNYTLQSGSTLINAGLDVGLPFSGAAPDIGAFEYS
jgi:hypothetical protein